MDLKLRDKVAIVTGASRGIGRAIAARLAAEGMAVVIVARDEAKLRELDGEIVLGGGTCLVHPADLRLPRAPAEVVRVVMERFGGIDLLVNNAGATKRGDFLTLKDEDWADGFALKFFGAMRLCREAWPHLSARRGNIVNIVGIGGRAGSAEFSIGGSVNAAMLNFTKCLADRGIIDRVRVNAINPGWIRTDRLTPRITRQAAERGLSMVEAEKVMAAELGVERFGEPEEIAAMVAFLASNEAGYIQGAIIDIDGGMTRAL